MMAARIKTMNHFSPKLRPPDSISKYQSEISEVIHSLIRSPQCYQMPPHQTSSWRVERYFISSSVDIFRSGAGRWVLEGGWVEGDGVGQVDLARLDLRHHVHQVQNLVWPIEKVGSIISKVGLSIILLLSFIGIKSI